METLGSGLRIGFAEKRVKLVRGGCVKARPSRAEDVLGEDEAQGRTGRG
jgi:hypothetical protein